MPKVKIEILRQVEVTRDESVTVEVNVPQDKLDDEDELHEWVEQQMNSTTGNELSNAVTDAGWDLADEDEIVDYVEVVNHS